MSTTDATLLPNDTYAANSGTTSHIGQLFFDQNLITEVEEPSPYHASAQDLTLDSQDGIGIGQATVDYRSFRRLPAPR